MAWFKGKCDRLKVPLFNVAVFFLSAMESSRLCRGRRRRWQRFYLPENTLSSALSFVKFFDSSCSCFLGLLLGSLLLCPTAPHTSRKPEKHMWLSPQWPSNWLGSLRARSLCTLPFFHSLFSLPFPRPSLKCICICALFICVCNSLLLFADSCFYCDAFLAEAKQNKTLKNTFKGSGVRDPHPLILRKSFTELWKLQQGMRICIHWHFKLDFDLNNLGIDIKMKYLLNIFR